jgi:hypothetical protein
MRFTAAKELEYKPIWKPDVCDSEDDPIVFTLAYLNQTERDDIIDVSIDAEGKPRVKPNLLKAFRRGVKKITGIVVNGEQIKSSDEFLRLSGFDTLYLEVATKIINMNAVTDLKNSP